MARKFIILLLCGTGIATSTAVRAKVEDALKREDLHKEVEFRQAKVADVLGGSTDADLVVATTNVPKSVSAPVINAVPLISGVGADAVLEKILNAVRSHGGA